MTAAQGPSLQGRLLLGRPALNRVDALRGDEGKVAAFWSDPHAQILVLHGDSVDLSADMPNPALKLAPTSSFGEQRPPGAFLLGLDGPTPMFGMIDDSGAEAEDGQLRSSLRQVGALLTERDGELITTTMALGNWHRNHPRCSRCGAETVVERAGWVRRCPVDDSLHFPRTDPAIIVLVIDSFGNALLGRRTTWEPTWFSTLAGFVEPGEAAESAVVREVGEEVGVAVDAKSVQFLGSQPWPFPSSIMLGFHAFAAANQAPQPDGEEIAEARWFSRHDLYDLCASGEVKIPPKISIARHLIEAWYGEELPGDWSR